MDALLAGGGYTPTDHKQRNDILRRTNTYAQIWKYYNSLYQLCRTVRYAANPAEWIPIEDIQPQVFDRCLYKVEESVRRLLNKDAEVFPPFERISLNGMN